MTGISPTTASVEPEQFVPNGNPQASPSHERLEHVTAGRIRAIDALRGFDMFWIVGAGTIVKALDAMSGNAVTKTLSTQFQHVQWEGLRFYDLIFPLFLFLIGVSLVLSMDRALTQKSKGAIIRQIVVRSVILFLFCVFYSGGLSHRWPEVALGGVLQRIAACYLIAALIYCWCATASQQMRIR